MPTLRSVCVASSDPGGYAAWYTTLNGALAGEKAANPSLPAADLRVDIICYPITGGDTTAVNISGWTTDTTRYPRIAPSPGTGVTSAIQATTAVYTLVGPNTLNALIATFNVNYIRVEGIQFDSLKNFVVTLGGTGPLFDRCFFRNAVNANNGLVVQQYSTGGRLRNCVLVNRCSNTGTKGVDGPYGGTTAFENCTIYSTVAAGSGILLNANASLRAQNTVVYGFATDFNANGKTWLATTSNNASKDTTAPGTSPVTGVASTVWATPGTDFSLTAAPNVLIDAAADLSGSFTTDINGVTRSVPGDIGAAEYVATAAFKAAWALGSNPMALGAA